MISVLLQTLIMASSGLLSIGSITLVILLLLSERGWRNGLAYALGYTSAYSLIGVSAVMLDYQAAGDKSGDTNLFLPVLLLILGTLLLWFSFRNRRKPPTENPEPPRLFAIVDGITPLRAFAFGAMVSVINLKNLALFLTALSIVILSGLPLSQKIPVAILAAQVFCLSVLIPVLIYLTFPRRAQMVLNTIRQGLNRYSRQIGIWLPLVFGLLFITKGITDLL